MHERDPLFLVLAPASSAVASRGQVEWARSLLRDLPPQRPAACLLLGSPPQLLSPLSPAPRALPTASALGESELDLLAGWHLLQSELARWSAGRPIQAEYLALAGSPAAEPLRELLAKAPPTRETGRLRARWNLEPTPFQQDDLFSWHLASWSAGQGEPPSVAKVANSPEAAHKLSREARVLARLGELAPSVPRLHDFLPPEESQPATLLIERFRAKPLSGHTLEPAQLLAVAGELAILGEALERLQLESSLRLSDLHYDQTDSRLWLSGWSTLRAAEQSSRPFARAWAETVATLMGATDPFDPFSWEEVGGHHPQLWDVLRRARGGAESPSQLLGALCVLPRRARAAELARRAGHYGIRSCLLPLGSPQLGPYYLTRWYQDAGTGLALDARLDTIVLVSDPPSPTALDTFVSKLPGESETRAYGVEPLTLSPDPPTQLPPPERPPRLLAQRHGGQVRLELSEIPPHVSEVLLVRGGEGSLLLPQDGQLLAALSGAGLQEPFEDTEGGETPRYAAFPLNGQRPGPPARARFD